VGDGLTNSLPTFDTQEQKRGTVGQKRTASKEFYYGDCSFDAKAKYVRDIIDGKLRLEVSSNSKKSLKSGE